jgi:hypothetical protein
MDQAGALSMALYQQVSFRGVDEIAAGQLSC